MKRSPLLTLARTGAFLAYILAVVGPAVVTCLLAPDVSERTPALHLGLVFSLLGFSILALQPLLSARPRWLDRLFGLDRLYRFHKAMAVAAGVLILLHPLLLAMDYGDFSLLSSFQWPWPVLLGKLGVLALIVIVLSSLLYAAIRLSHERWRGLHNLAVLVLLAAGFVHAWLTGRDLLLLVPLRVIFAVLLAVGVAAYAAHKVIGPARRRLFTVAGLRQETPNAWTLALTPGPGSAPLASLPGQFQFIALERMPPGNVRPEEHPFTIASCGCGGQTHESTIKESGDFTRTIREVRSGDRVRVQGPFGRFSYLLHPEERDFAFIAGGIGITPFMSMIRHMQSTGAEARVLLLYANRTREDIAFREELETIARGAHPRLEVVHVLERPPADWEGEVGRIGHEMIGRLLGGSIADRAFYVCGPPRMMKGVLGSLRRLGVPRRRLHSERFAL